MAGSDGDGAEGPEAEVPWGTLGITELDSRIAALFMNLGRPLGLMTAAELARERLKQATWCVEGPMLTTLQSSPGAASLCTLCDFPAAGRTRARPRNPPNGVGKKRWARRSRATPTAPSPGWSAGPGKRTGGTRARTRCGWQYCRCNLGQGIQRSTGRHTRHARNC